MIIGQTTTKPNAAARWLAGASLAALTGCASAPSSINPVSWWHDLQGGAIAQQRPPPPNSTDPYPSLATVPNKPQAADPALRAGIANALVADRTAAQRVAAAEPLADPSLPSASPQLFGKGTAAPPAPASASTAGVSASIPAAEAPPPSRAAQAANAAASATTAAPPARAPRSAVASTPLPPDGGLAPSDLPPLPSGPPPPAAVGPGVAPPSARVSATPSPTTPAVSSALSRAAAGPPPQPAPVTLGGPAPVAIAFTPGSASVPPESVETLRGLAARRGGSTIAVTGYGESASSDPSAQSTAVALGLNRAQAIAAVLASAGVPSTAVRVDAEAAGKGGAVRLLN